jgi:hypothetical protein
MAITEAEIEREKQRLPRGWGRFGKTLEQLAELSEPDESLLCTCVALNPDFQHRQVGVPGGLYHLAGALHEMTKTTNVVLASTSERLIAIGTGMGGAPRDNVSMPYAGLEIVSRGKKEFVLGWPDTQMRVRGAHKSQAGEFLDTLAAHARPASVETLGER